LNTSLFSVLSKISQNLIHASFLTKHRSLVPSFTISKTTKLNHLKADYSAKQEQ